MAVIESPISERGAWKKGSVIGQVLNGTKYKGVRGGRRLDVTGKGKIKSTDNHRFWDNSGVSVVGGGVDLVVAGKGISGSKFGARENFPDNIEVL